MEGKILPGICLILLIGFGCKDENTESCMDVGFGQVKVDPENKFPLPYDGDETLIFKDSLDHEMLLSPRLFLSPYFLDAIDTIREGSCAGEVVAYGKLERKYLSFSNDSLGYRLSISHSVYLELDKEKPVFYDVFSASYYIEDEPFPFFNPSVRFVTDDRGNNLNPFYIYEQFKFEESLSLRSKTFSQVYYTTGTNGTAVYFNHEMGFVGFREEGGALWVLDRIE